MSKSSDPSFSPSFEYIRGERPRLLLRGAWVVTALAALDDKLRKLGETHGAETLAELDLTEFIHDELLDRLEVRPVDEVVAIHATCSNRKMNLSGKLAAVAGACAKEVVTPEDIPCCGWAGDKGFTVPELNANALRNLESSLPEGCRDGFSTSRTCEIGLSQHSGRYYRSIAYLVDRCSRPGGKS